MNLKEFSGLLAVSLLTAATTAACMIFSSSPQENEQRTVQQNVIDKFEKQKYRKWCWVACAQALLKQKNINETQENLFKTAKPDIESSIEQEEGYSDDICNAINGLRHINVHANTIDYAVNTAKELKENLTSNCSEYGCVACNIGNHWVVVLSIELNKMRIYDPLNGRTIDIQDQKFLDFFEKICTSHKNQTSGSGYTPNFSVVFLSDKQEEQII